MLTLPTPFLVACALICVVVGIFVGVKVNAWRVRRIHARMLRIRARYGARIEEVSSRSFRAGVQKATIAYGNRRIALRP